MSAQAEHAGPAAWGELKGVLAGSWLSAADREALLKASRALSGRLHRQTAALDLAEDRAHKPTPPLPAPDRALAVRSERERGLQRARLSVVLLKLEGAPPGKELEQALAQTSADPKNEAAWQALSRELRRAWNQRVPVNP